MRTRVRGWRWRRNPLRRRSDVIEAWTVLVVAVLLLVGAPAVGAAVAWWAHGQARAVAAEQRAERRQVRAEVIGATPETLPSVQAGGQHSYRATVRWSEPGEAPRTTAARLPARTRHGETVDVWLDARGRSVPPPADAATVWRHAVTMGVCATAGSAATVLLGHCAVRRVALRRRMTEWDRAWARTEPQWSHRDA
ncbi:Rv1733c family protein [Streptomyces sp. JW3]|uniref:Rv1733c family protein n=1 Tax=Streptomyces sp. JW3 TaxID=3456955 RepID=UPI003FA48964